MGVHARTLSPVRTAVFCQGPRCSVTTRGVAPWFQNYHTHLTVLANGTRRTAACVSVIYTRRAGGRQVMSGQVHELLGRSLAYLGLLGP
jgi:hypothetical protein